jgi:rod shape-determining protein MreC
MSMLTVSYRAGGDPFGATQMRALQVVSPLERGLSRAWAPVQGAADWVTTLVRATNENPDLRKRLDVAEARLSIMQDIDAENSRLRDIVALQERGRFPNGYHQVVGSVIARPPTAIDRSLVIDLGSDDGVSVNDPVMVTRGLIGRVEAVSSNAARVGLVIDRTQAVSASVVDSNATGVLRPISNEGTPVMELAYVSQRVRVSPGDVVVTSGWSTGDLHSIYPRGIPFGVVSSVGSSPADLYKTVQVTPFADFDRIDEVIVLTPTAATRAARDYVDPDATDTQPVTTSTQRGTHRGKEAARGRTSTHGTRARPRKGAA